MGKKLVTVARFGDVVEAEMARQRLADEGIRAVLEGENVAVTWGAGPMTDLELQTFEEDAERAKQILESEQIQE